MESTKKWFSIKCILIFALHPLDFGSRMVPIELCIYIMFCSTLSNSHLNSICLFTEFLLGDNLLVTPVVYEDATLLHVVFPPGVWQSPESGVLYEGPSKVVIANISLQSIVYFTRFNWKVGRQEATKINSKELIKCFVNVSLNINILIYI